MAVAVFDMDDTLVDGDSANLWLHFLVARGLAPAEMLPFEENLLQAYRAGQVDMHEFMRFALIPLRGLAPAVVQGWLSEFVNAVILPRIFPQALGQLEWHRQRQDRLVIVSATGEHLVSEIARRLSVDDSLGILLQTEGGVYSGDIHGVLSYREGKVTRLLEWMQRERLSLAGSYGYSDSLNDIPLLEAVELAHAVNPDPTLRALAEQRSWQVLRWEHASQPV